MHYMLWILLFLLQYPCVNSQFTESQHSNNILLPNILESFEIDGIVENKAYSWARGNLSCSHLLEESQYYLKVIPPLSVQLVKPAIVLGLMHVGCLSETDPLYMDIIKDDDTRNMFNLLLDQWKISVHLTSHYPRKKNKVDSEALRLNLETLSPGSLFGNVTYCSGFRQRRPGMMLNGYDQGKYSSLLEAAIHCDQVGPSCAGVSLDSSGEFHTVSRSGGYIIPQKGFSVWLHHCPGVHKRRRSLSSQCQNDQEEGVYNVMQWVPVVSGWYNAGSAIYYATKGCGTQAEVRAIEASLDLGYDALLAGTGGTFGVGLGQAVKPALKAGVKAAIKYFKNEPLSNQITSMPIIFNTTISSKDNKS
ncbi:apolipoprotein F [Pelodytes ibericus]